MGLVCTRLIFTEEISSTTMNAIVWWMNVIIGHYINETRLKGQCEVKVVLN